MKRIGVLTSGGDAPGMNAAIRAIVRAGKFYNMEIIGIEHGYEGLINGEFTELQISDVGDILHRGGTILKTARSKRFMTEEGLDLAVQNLNNNGIEGVIVCGGDGSFKGALSLQKKGIAVAGVPCTIDNDMGYTDFTIGFDSAINTVLDAMDKIRDTSSAHERICIIDVMGRHCGDIALFAGLAGGADAILIPEVQFNMDELLAKIRNSRDRKKKHSIIIRAEGCEMPLLDLCNAIQDNIGQEVTFVVLGYLQRGGTPTGNDRLLANLTGSRAVQLMYEDKTGYAVGMVNNDLCEIKIEDAVQTKREANLSLLSLAKMLAI